ncbi:hypothetical protein PtA15_7A636 [Puccinia triticina]|uniref:Uncharacterized protein n=1 Tax=Puccinia triticina TaxID=208348 RepID=A0ABY7CW07_9BASI|nr:uncharacterized protein PtA15_7A636 [Puccinia triticina]WAQ86907.1 hypothetical protein PtA15_7A636 [Puccinia triticina]WAR56776.1 hypothetical protein PtB15_7B626 [Puccinia triticina]
MGGDEKLRLTARACRYHEPRNSYAVIELIAGFVAIQLPFQPPSSLLSLTITNKHIYSLLRPERNDQLYATIFRNLFDVKALQRRLRAFPLSDSSTATPSPPTSSTGQLVQGTDPTGVNTLTNRGDQNEQADQSDGHIKSSAGGCIGHPDQATEEPAQEHTRPTTTNKDGSELCNRHLAAAYFERLGLFRRMRIFAAHPAPTSPDRPRATDLEPYKNQPAFPQPGNHPMSLLSRDLWLIYLMVLENDGRNWSQLLKSGHIVGFLLNYFHYEISLSATSPGYPKERPEIAIALRLCHLFLDLQQEGPESGPGSDAANYWTSEAGIETYLFALKPYTLASHQYDVAYAAWSIRQLPINLSSQAVLRVLSTKLTRREMAALTPSPPVREPSPEERELSPGSSTSTDGLSYSDSYDQVMRRYPEQPIKRYSQLTYMGRLFRILPPLHSHVALLSFFWCNIRHNTGVAGTQQTVDVDDQLEFFLEMMRSVVDLRSEEYDREFVRQTSCLDPYMSPGLQFDFYRGCFRGGWDGQFGFFDLSSYRLMLGGQIEAVYQGRYGDQNQVFKVQEFFVRVRDNQPVEFLGDSREKYLEQPRRPSSTASSEAVAEEKKEPMESEIEHLNQMQSLLYPVPIDPVLVEYDPAEEYELQIHGAGHSSWGSFKVKGRVRAWDGMVTFLKIYDAGRHGTWLYRGYHAAGNMIVGRWRDTHTSEAADGYEGTFVMFTRN